MASPRTRKNELREAQRESVDLQVTINCLHNWKFMPRYEKMGLSGIYEQQ